MSPWKLMLLPFLECLVLVGIHSYLGIHVIKRKVIFVDLALAQIAALGTIVAFLFGIQPHTISAYVFSLLFTFLGAAVFSLTRLREDRVPQEAIIGLVYALAAAVSILVIDRAPHGAEHIKEALTGSILWVRWQAVAVAAAVYAAVGAFHYVFRARFWVISEDPVEARRRGIRVRLWDFLFYMTFGLVITVSVNVAGVLLVFVFLVVPAIMAVSITERLPLQLVIGWSVGTAVSFLGLAASYAWDFPTGPTVVVVYCLALLVVALALCVIRATSRRRAISHLLAGLISTAAVVAVFFGLGEWLGHDHHHGSEAAHAGLFPGPDTEGGDHDGHHGKNDPRPLLDRLAEVDITQRDVVIDRVTDAGALERAGAATDDEEIRVAIGRRLLALQRRSGRQMLFEVLRDGEIPLFRQEALNSLAGLSGDDFGYDPLRPLDSEGNQQALRRWERWTGGHEPAARRE